MVVISQIGCGISTVCKDLMLQFNIDHGMRGQKKVAFSGATQNL